MLVARETPDWPRITSVISGAIASRRKLTKAVVLTSGNVITRDYATSKRRSLRLHDSVHGTTVDLGRNYSVFSELVALSTAVLRRQLVQIAYPWHHARVLTCVSFHLRRGVEATAKIHGVHMSNFIMNFKMNLIEYTYFSKLNRIFKNWIKE